MENRGYFFVLVVVLLVLSVGSAQMSSDNYNSTVIVTNGGDNNTIVGIISGDMSSDNYSNQLGFFYDSNVGPDDPVVSIITASGNNISSDDVLCSANVYDSNGGSLTVETRWYLNDSLNLTINYSSISNGEFNATLDSDYTTKYDNWSCSMRLYDGSLYSSWGNSSNLTILNNAPTVTLVSPVNGNVTSDRSPTFTWTGSDIDGDDLTYDINISLYDSVQDTRHETGLTNLTYTPSDLLFLWDNVQFDIYPFRFIISLG